jgi:hypothetical protein
MNNPNSTEQTPSSRQEMMAALFANLVMQHTNMAFMFLGRMPHPETGEVVQDLESAKFFIDQLEMLEAKTKGNLDKQEDGLLKQSLTGLRMAFVDAVTKQGAEPSPAQKITPEPQSAKAVEQPAEAVSVGTEAKPSDDESKKKFSKKY